MYQTTIKTLACTSILALSPANATDPLYKETFTVHKNSTASEISWMFHAGTRAKDYSSKLRFQGKDLGVSIERNAFRAKGGIPTGNGTNFLLSTSKGGTFIYQNLDSISAVVGQDDRGGTSSAQTYRLAIRTSQGWFVSNASKSMGPTPETGTVLVKLITERKWHTLVFDSGSSLELGPICKNQPSGIDEIYEYGVYWEQEIPAANWMSIDDFTIHSAERVPSSTLLGLGGFTILLRDEN